MSDQKTIFLLMAEYGTSQIPVEQCAGLFGLDSRQAKRAAMLHRLPIRAYRLGTQKSPWVVSAEDLAAHIDAQKALAEEEWKKLNAA